MSPYYIYSWTCIWFPESCLSGEELKGGKCTNCSIGFYRVQGQDDFCVPCDNGNITLYEGSKSKDECTIGKAESDTDTRLY